MEGGKRQQQPGEPGEMGEMWVGGIAAAAGVKRLSSGRRGGRKVKQQRAEREEGCSARVESQLKLVLGLESYILRPMLRHMLLVHRRFHLLCSKHT